jgi:DNA-binding NarL/FixJ family response regulator
VDRSGCDHRFVPTSVLVVDDDAAFRDIARRLLVADGFAVVGEADSVAAAGATARRLRPDAALIDIGLPDGDGLTLAGELIALSWHPRVVLTSTDPYAVTAEDVCRVGARAFIAKEGLPNAPLRRLLDGR